MTRLLRDLKDATAATPAAVDRLAERVAAGDAPATALLRHLPNVPAGATERLVRRLAAPRRPRRAWVAVVVVVAVALALFWPHRPVPVEIAVEPDLPPVPLASLTPEDLGWGADVRLSYAGTGEVSGSTRVPVIRWDYGTLGVDVRHGAGVTLVVQTPDARVDVVGTALDVTRDTLGTRVTVHTGTVRVTCEDRADLARLVAAPEAVTCLPARAAGLLGRARALHAEGMEIESLRSLERGLARSVPGDPVRGELLAFEAEVCVALGRHVCAEEAAILYGREGYAVRDDELSPLLKHKEEP